VHHIVTTLLLNLITVHKCGLLLHVLQVAWSVTTVLLRPPVASTKLTQNLRALCDVLSMPHLYTNKTNKHDVLLSKGLNTGLSIHQNQHSMVRCKNIQLPENRNGVKMVVSFRGWRVVCR